MQENVRKHMENVEGKRKEHRKIRMIATICGVLVAAGIFCRMALPGIAMVEPKCGLEEHTHTTLCNSDNECTQVEHVHTLACYSDVTADVEDEAQWTGAFTNLERSESWGVNVAAIARTQIGYTESDANYSVTENEEQKGYTRYGAWSGDPYTDWNTAFAAFCFYYAEIPEDAAFPVDMDIEQWITSLQEAGLYEAAAEAVPVTGDLVILKKQYQETEKQAGIVSGVDETNGTITVIEGNCDNQVKENVYSISSAEVEGYGLLSRRETAYKSAGAEDGIMTAGLEAEEETAALGDGEGDTSAASENVPENETKETINERLAIEIVAGDAGANAETGETLYAKVVSRYSKANNPNENVEVFIRVGELPEGVTLAGFTDGAMEIVWRDENSNEHTIIARIVEDNGQTYIKFEQPAGATVEFNVQFNSENGIMADNSSVTLEIAKNMITGLDSEIGDNDKLGEPLTLTWNAENEWDPVDKRVNGTKNNEIAVSVQNKLSGTLIYTITANSSNREETGEIWTDYIEVTDTLTLPQGISFPTGAGRGSSDNNKDEIVTQDGKTILSFTDLQGGEITDLYLEGSTVTYKVKVPNSHRNSAGTLEAEQDNLSLEMELNADLLVLTDGYADKNASEMKQDKIENHVVIQPVPCQEYEVDSSEDTVATVPSTAPEEFELTKNAVNAQGGTAVTAGGVIEYTITLENTGNSPIKVYNDEGEPYLVKDILPEYLYLTESQIAALKQYHASYDEAAGQITWMPSQSDIKAGEICTFTFSATVKSAADDSLQKLPNGSYITNTASYKDRYSNEARVTYEKAVLTIDKTSQDADGDGEASNGEKVIYTIKVINDTALDAAVNEIVTDTLPDGLIFESAAIGENTEITESGDYLLHAADENCGMAHNVKFTVNGQQLKWDVGIVHAHETVILTYVCRVDTDKLGSRTQINNTAVSTSGGSDTDTISVDYPIKLDKTVDKDTGVTYADKTIFTYTLTVANDSENPSEKESYELVDELPAGMLPYGYTLMQIPQSWNQSDVEKEIAWEEFAEGPGNYWNCTYTTVINGYTVSVERLYDGRITLTWHFDKLKPGETLTISYQTQMNLTDEQLESGGQYAFTNTAIVDGIKKTVTVYGGRKVGNLSITKDFIRYYAENGLTDHMQEIPDELMQSLIFELTGVDSDGNEIIFNDGSKKQTVTLEQFAHTYGSCYWTYTFKNLPVGIYTITEKNTELEDTVLTTEYKVDGTHSVDGHPEQAVVTSNQTTQVSVTNKYTEGPCIDLQKSVWAIIKETKGEWGNYTWNKLPGKDLFAVAPDSNTTSLVVYNLTVINTGGEAIHLDTMKDEVPEGLTYIGMCGYRWFSSKNDFGTDTYTNQWGGLNSYDGMNLADGVHLTSTIDAGSNTVTIGINQAEGGYDLQKGQAISFLVLCEAQDDEIAADEPLTNTAKILVDKETIGYSDYQEIETTNTPYDKNQNNGGSAEVITQDGMREISSSVTITPENTIVPGISKNAVAYIPTGTTTENTLDEYTNIPPQSAVKWEVTLFNDGTEDMTDYSVKDVVTSRFHLFTEEEAKAYEVDSPYKLNIFAYDDSLIGSYDVSEEVWETIQSGSEVSEYTFIFRDKKYTIPAGGYARLTLYTNNTVENYKNYKNTATLIPTQEFNANKVRHGELQKDSDGRYVGVTASDEVCALGDYASVSWKTIAETADETNTARGTQDKNYISVDRDSQYVTYTNNIRNVSGKDFNGFVVVDTMPSLNDTGVVNQNDKRGSEFTVIYDGGLEVYVLDQEQEKTLVEGYTIEFSSRMSFTQEDFDGEDSGDWHDSWKAGDKTFRIKLPDSFVLKPQQTLVVQYNGKIGADAKPGAIAWNSFGYQYYSIGYSNPMKAEPPKVGVMIPKVPTIEKEVVDSSGQIQEKDANREFTFEIRDKASGDKLCEFTVCQGGYRELADLTDADGHKVKLENGREYVISEVIKDMPEGYELIGIGEKGGIMGEEYTFTYYENKDITILARNEVDTYRPELPGTGGIGIFGYTAGGALLMLAASLMYGYRLRRRRERRRE